MANKVSNDQLDELLEYLAQHPALVKGVGLGSRSKEAIEREWNNLAVKLNSFGSGSSKTGERWKKYWFDLKHKVKTRASKRRQDAQGTGGGPSTQEDLSDFDQRVLLIIGENAVYGDTQHRIPVFNIQPELAPELEHIEDAEVIISDTTEDVNIMPIASSSAASNGMHAEFKVETQQVAEARCTGGTGVKSAGEQPYRRRRRLRHSQSPQTTNRLHRRIDPEWVMELERARVEAEQKMANAYLIMAEAANKIADAALMNAETSRQQVEIFKLVGDVVTHLSKELEGRGNN